MSKGERSNSFELSVKECHDYVYTSDRSEHRVHTDTYIVCIWKLHVHVHVQCVHRLCGMCIQCVHVLHLQLNRVGLKSDKETRQELLRSTQSHEHLLDTRAPQDSPPVAEKTKKESKQRGRFFKLLMKKRTMVKSGRKGVKGRRHTGEGEEGEGGARGETEHGEEESQSFLTSSISMPNIACEL